MAFIFGGNTPWTYEQLQRKRAVADSLLGSMGEPKNVGEGLAAIGKALAYRGIEKRAGKEEARMRGEFDAKWGALLGGTSGGGAPGMAAPQGGYPGPSGPPLPPPDPNSPHALGDAAMAALGKPAVKTAADPASIKAGLVARGLPEHIAEGFVMNMQDESGLNPGINEANPVVPGSRGGFGLYQLTGPRRKAYEAYAAQRGVPLDDVDAQLDFMMSELQGPEAAAWEKISRTQNAGEAGAAIVNNFLRPASEHAASRTADYLGSQGAPQGGMDIGALVGLASDPMASPAQKAVVEALIQQQLQAADPLRAIEMQKAQLELAQMQDPQADPMEAIKLKQAELDYQQDQSGGGADPATYGTTLQFFTDADGKMRAGVLGNDGTMKEIEPPDGGEWSTGIDKVDAGTKWIIYDKRTGEKIGEEVKDLRGAEAEKAIGQAEGEATGAAITGLGAAESKAAEGIALIDSIINDEALPGITGMVQGRLPPLTQAGTDLNVKIEQVQGKAFLEAFESLKGGGAISEREGEAATKAIARLQRAQSTEAYQAALTELKGILQTGLNNMKKKAGPTDVTPSDLDLTEDDLKYLEQP